MKHPHGANRRRVVATAGLLGVVGASLLSGVAQASPAAPAAPASPAASEEARSIQAPAVFPDGQAMNYAVNLLPGISADDFAAAVAQVEGAHGVVLEQYPELATFFVQSASAGFIGDMANNLARVHIPFDSIGPTRQAAVAGAEKVVATSPEGRSALRLQSQLTTSQLDREAALGAEVVPDPLSSFAWGLTAIGALAAQDVDVPLEPVTVGVLDSGVDGTHPDLKDQIDADKSVGCANNGIPDTSWDAWQDTDGHGTHVAGTIAAAHNGVGVDGVAPHARLAAVRTGNDEGFFYPEYVTCAFVWAADHGFDVTNNSYYTDPWEYWVPGDNTQAAGLEAVTRAVSYSEAHGVVNVAAAGNSDNDLDNLTTDSGSPNDNDAPIKDRDVSTGVDIPAELPGVLTVSAVAMPGSAADPATATLVRSGFSNYGAKAIDVAAPGSRIASSYKGAWAYLSGTSMASPHVAGVAALLSAIHPDFTPQEISDLLVHQAGYTYDRLAVDDKGKEYRGAGLVNALAAVLKDQPQPTIGEAEYSTDQGATWAPLAGATVQGKVQVRLTVSGPVTSATLSLGDEELASGAADGSFSGPGVTLEATLDLSGIASPEDLELSVAAEGRNKDPQADDDVTSAVAFSAKPVPAPEPEPSGKPSEEPGGQGGSTPKPTTPATPVPDASPTATQGASLASTGAESGVLTLAGLALLGGASALVARRLRSARD